MLRPLFGRRAFLYVLFAWARIQVSRSFHHFQSSSLIMVGQEIHDFRIFHQYFVRTSHSIIAPCTLVIECHDNLLTLFTNARVISYSGSIYFKRILHAVHVDRSILIAAAIINIEQREYTILILWTEEKLYKMSKIMKFYTQIQNEY